MVGLIWERQRTAQYGGMVDAFGQIARKEGIRAFFKGFGAVAAMTMPAHALYFGGFEAAKKLLEPSQPKNASLAPLSHFASGFIADICGSIIWCPMDVIKQRVQMHSGSKSGFQNSWSAARSIVQSHGILGLYRGAPAAILTFGPYVGLYFSFYEYLKSQIAQSPLQTGPSISTHLIASFSAASIAAFITCPIDVVKTNMQVYSVADGGASTALGTAKALYRSGGLLAFLRGWNARILWLAPGSAITMAAYEQCKSIVGFLAPS